MASRTGTHSISPALALCLAVIGAASMIYYHEALFMPRSLALQRTRDLGNGYSFGNDFYQVWLTCREGLRGRVDLYSPEMTREIQAGLYGRPLDPTRPGDPIDRRAFPYPAFTNLLFWPIAEIRFESVRVIFVGLLALITLFSAPLWLRVLDWRPDWKWSAVVALLTLSSYPSLEGLFAGQLGLLVAFLLAASVVALRRQRFVLAGVLMSLTTVKPQVTALAIFYLLLWSFDDWPIRKRFVMGFVSTLALLVGGSLMVWPHWIGSWIHTVLAYRHYTQPTLVTEVLTSAIGERWAQPGALLLTAASLAIGLVVSWKNRAAALDSFDFWLTLSVLLSVTVITILPGQAVYDHLILVPVVLLIIRHRDLLGLSRAAPRMVISVATLVLFWPWIAALAVIVVRQLAPALCDSSLVLSLPLRAAGSLPFALLALLGWLWRINLRTTRERA